MARILNGLAAKLAPIALQNAQALRQASAQARQTRNFGQAQRLEYQIRDWNSLARKVTE